MILFKAITDGVVIAECEVNDPCGEWNSHVITKMTFVSLLFVMLINDEM
ncbi:hypothetical protein [Staphylococcus lutrae]|nr:hypothetical protein [Staphylococcus lutrae]